MIRSLRMKHLVPPAPNHKMVGPPGATRVAPKDSFGGDEAAIGHVSGCSEFIDISSLRDFMIASNQGLSCFAMRY